MKLKLQQLFDTLGMSYGQIATAISEMSGEPITSDLIRQAASGLPVTAKHADTICKWLSQQFGREFQPTADIADMRIHPASALPEKANTTESATLRNEKIEGFLAGFNLAYAARFNHQKFSNEEVHHLAEVATSKHRIFQESAGQPPALNYAQAYQCACAFAANGVTVMFDQPNGMKKFQELKAMDKGEREQYARNMARSLLQYM